MIDVQSLNFSYKKSDPLVLNGLGVSFPQHGIVSILGPNGCGKTTLLKCLSGILKYVEGNIFIKGRNLQISPKNELATMISYVPQDCSVAFNMSVFDYVMLGRLPYINWAVSDADRNYTLQALDFMGLRPLADKTVNELSGGQKQLVSIARAMAQNTEIILMDEPLSALDIKHSLMVLGKIMHLATYKQALVVVVMHDIEMASRYSSEIIVLKKGRVYGRGSPKDIITRQMLSDVYEVEAEVTSDGRGCRIDWETPGVQFEP